MHWAEQMLTSPNIDDLLTAEYQAGIDLRNAAAEQLAELDLPGPPAATFATAAEFIAYRRVRLGKIAAKFNR